MNPSVKELDLVSENELYFSLQDIRPNAVTRKLEQQAHDVTTLRATRIPRRPTNTKIDGASKVPRPPNKFRNGDFRLKIRIVERKKALRFRVSACFQTKSVGWLMGLEPTTTGITIRDSTN